MRRSLLSVLVAAVMAGVGGVGGAPAPAAPVWEWPIAPVRVVAPFVAPPHPYGRGHRGVDLLAVDVDPPVSVRAPAAGVVAFAGQVAGRELITIDHRDGHITTLEPVEALLAAGSEVNRGEVVGVLAAGGHTAAGTLHLGVRRHGEYINPLLMLGGVPRAVLYPCC